MKKTIILLTVLLVQLTAWAELHSGHFFKTLKSEILTEQDAVERFSQWFALPQETEWRKVDERTDRLGMTRVEYRQYVCGVEVEHSQVLLHMRDGRVQTANGTVMEVRQAPARLRRYAKAFRDGTPTDLLGRQLFLVSTKDGYRYATKTLSADRSEWIYIDADTDEVLKRIPTHYDLTAEPVKVTGRSIYSGDVQMDASQDSENGHYLLWDQQRNIHTMIGATLPSIQRMKNELFIANFPQFAATLPVPMEEMTDELWSQWFKMLFATFDIKTLNTMTYITRNALYANSTEPTFDSYVLGSLTIDRLASADEEEGVTEIVPSKFNPLTLLTNIQYTGTEGMIERSLNTIERFPFTLDLKQFYDEIPAAGVDIYLYAITQDETNQENPMKKTLLTTISLVPDGSGQAEWETELVRASATYEKGPWSAADIHWGMQQTYDYYQELFGRTSFDGNGAPIYNLFYMPDEDSQQSYILATVMNNACAAALGTSQMIYGMGNRLVGKASMYPVVELSIMAHEFTHLVTDATADLVYQGESGALNESFSDILGISVKKYVQGNDAPWTIGANVGAELPDLRSMSFPKTSMGGMNPNPDTYQGEFWVDTESEQDHGGVHTNSGVQNKWYYLLTDGDSGTNDHGYSYQVDGIGLEKSQQIAYRTLTEYATEESQYADIRLASLQAAEDLFGEEAPEIAAVDDAWKAVGVSGNGEVTAIKSIASTEDVRGRMSDEWYSLDGRKLQGKPTAKGLYIHGGRTIVIM